MPNIPQHLKYLSKPLEWYIQEHRERQAHMGNSRSGLPAYTLDQLLKRNKNREYKGVHEFCAAEEQGEILTCVIFKRDEPREYFHTLYFGIETQNPDLVHEMILERLKLSPAQYQRSLIAKHCGTK